MANRIGDDWCRCKTCLMFTSNYGILRAYGNGQGYWTYVEGDCDLCKKWSKDVESGNNCTFVPPIVKEFLQVELVCKNCRNYLNHFLLHNFKGCWEKSDTKVIELAMLMALNSKLRNDASGDFRLALRATRISKEGRVGEVILSGS